MQNPINFIFKVIIIAMAHPQYQQNNTQSSHNKKPVSRAPVPRKVLVFNIPCFPIHQNRKNTILKKTILNRTTTVIHLSTEYPEYFSIRVCR